MSKRARLFLAMLLVPTGALLLLTAFFIPRAASAIAYTVIDLATLEQGGPVVVRGPNGTGAAVGGGRMAGGAGKVAGARLGLLFTRGGPQHINGLTAASDFTTVFGINDAGAFVGSSNTATTVRAFMGTQAGGMRELPPLAGDSASIAFAVNNPGQAVGFSSGRGGEHAVIWAADGTVTALPGVSSVTNRALGINDRGVVVGVTDIGVGRRAIQWSPGGAAQELPILRGHTTSEAMGVNSRGDVVGYSADPIGTRRATLWQSRGRIVDVGTLPGGNFSQALGINDRSGIVGTSTSSVGTRAFLWTPTGGIQDLNALIAPSSFVLTQAVGINTAGMIIAIGNDVGGGAGSHGHDAHELPVRVFLLLPAGVQP